MTLDKLKPGQSARITQVGGEGSLRQHFLDMGVIPGAEITLVKLAPMKDPMEFRIHGYELNSFCVKTADNTEGIQCTFCFKGTGAGISISHNVGLNGTELVVTGVDTKNVCLGTVGGNYVNGDTGRTLNLITKNTAVSVICTGSTAGTHSHSTGAATSGQTEYHSQTKNKC